MIKITTPTGFAAAATRLRFGILLALIAGSACSKGATPAPPQLQIEQLPLAAAAPSLAPQLTVSGDRAVVSWLETQDRTALLKFSERSGSGWSEPRTVASGDDWFVNSADVPSVTRLDDGTLAAHWLQNIEGGEEAYDLRLAFSKDDGRTWTAPVSPHHDGTKTEHGFASLFQAPGAGVGLVWLDGRAVVKENDNMSLRAAVFDRNGAQQSETLLDDRVCDCCPTAAAITSDGPIVAFRDRSAGEVRDIAVSRLVAGRWTAAKTVHDDGWQIAACPVNGPALSANGRRVAVAWMSGKDDQGRAFAAFSDDAGAAWGSPIRLDDGSSLGRVGVELLDDGSAVATWVEFAGQRAQLRTRWIDSGGARGAAQTIAGLGSERTSGYPRLARRGRELLVAWTETLEGRSAIRTAAVHW
jgi:hypothetical protein